MHIQFLKYEALGNDFIVIDESQDEKLRKEPSLSLSLRRRMCHRKLGVGADGVITLLPPTSKEGAVFMHVTNADGSIPENCGNGLRCVARYWADSKGSLPLSFVIDTLSGQKRAKVDGVFIQVGIGLARLSLDMDAGTLTESITSFSRRFNVKAPEPVAYVDLGNPHFVLECDEIDLAQKELGPKLEKAAIFPNGANISFVRKESATVIALRTWERGAGATDACGSGAGASVASFVATGRLAKGQSVAVHFRNGVLSVDARATSELEYDVSLSGSAQKLFVGTWESSESDCD